MVLFDEFIVEILDRHILNQYLDSVSITSCGIGFRFCDSTIHCNERVFAKIAGESFEWVDAPNNSPWGALVRQNVKKVSLISKKILRIAFQSGDYLDIETLESSYESVIINLPSKDDVIVMETF